MNKAERLADAFIEAHDQLFNAGSYPVKVVKELERNAYIAARMVAEQEFQSVIEAAIIAYEEWNGGQMDNFIKSMDRLGELVEPLRCKEGME